MNQNCSACNIKTDVKIYKKDRTVCESCYNKKKRKNTNDTLIQNKTTVSYQQPKIQNGNNNKNNRTILIGPSSSGQTSLMLKIFSRIPTREIYIITKSPPEQYFNSKIKIKGITEEIKPISEYESAIIVFDDILDSSNSRLVDQYFTRVRHKYLDIYYLSQSYFDLPKRTIRNNSNKIILFNQTLKDNEPKYRDVAGYDMSFSEFKEFCRKSWDEDYSYFCIDISKKREQGSYCICNENKNIYIYIEWTPQMKAFWLHKCYIQLKGEKIWKN